MTTANAETATTPLPGSGEIDPAAQEEFAERLLAMHNQAGLALITSLGHRTGLFDTLAEVSPATSRQVADAAGLEERYVREALAALTTGGFVLYDPVATTYELPPEHASLLTRAAGADNFAAMAQFIPVIAQVEDGIVDSFHQGGGVPYSCFDRFHEVQAEAARLIAETALVEEVLPLAPGLEERLENGIEVLDVGCGAGHAMRVLAREFPASRFTGYDLSEEAMERGRRHAREAGVENLRFEKRDVATLDDVHRWDLVTAFDAIHDQADPATVLAGIRRALAPDGVFLMQDIAGSSRLEENLDHPLAPFLYTVSTMHCMTVSLAQDGEGLGTMWGREKALEMLADAGFGPVEVHSVEADFLNLYYVTTPAR